MVAGSLGIRWEQGFHGADVNQYIKLCSAEVGMMGKKQTPVVQVMLPKREGAL